MKKKEIKENKHLVFNFLNHVVDGDFILSANNLSLDFAGNCKHAVVYSPFLFGSDDDAADGLEVAEVLGVVAVEDGEFVVEVFLEDG